MKKYAIFVPLIIALGAVSFFLYSYSHSHRTALSPNPEPAASNQKAATTKFAHFFIIVEENKPYQSVIGNSSAPYINQLADKYSLATNYYAVSHPSLPNYIALTSGSTQGITTDCNPPTAGCEIDVTNIADALENAGLSWKEYAESMPSSCYALNSGDYATKHNPFLYYQNIINVPARCQAHVVPFSQLGLDLRSVSTTPAFAMITPNLCNDMHNCSIATGDAWLATEVPMILNSKAFTSENSLLVITWDEGDSGDNHIPTIFVGPSVKQVKLTSTYNHYSLLRTVEANWNLSPLSTGDAAVSPITGFDK